MPQRCIALFPMTAADWIDHQLNTAAVSKFLQDGKPVLVAIIDRMIETTLAQEPVLPRTRRPISGRANLLGDVERGKADATAGIVNQNRFIRLERTHHVKQRIGSQVVDRNRRRLFESQRLGLFKDLIRADRNLFRLPPETRESHNRFTYQTTID